MKGQEKLDALAAAAGEKQEQSESFSPSKSSPIVHQPSGAGSESSGNCVELEKPKPAVILPKQDGGVSTSKQASNLTQKQQLQNAIASGVLGGVNSQIAASALLPNQAGVATPPLNQVQTDQGALALVQQQLAYYQYVQALAVAQQAQAQQVVGSMPPNRTGALLIQGGVASKPQAPAATPTLATATKSSNNTMLPPPPPSQATPTATEISPGGILAVQRAASQAYPLKPPGPSPGDEYGEPDRKQQKRAANRRSAQLSRKRKKLYIEELKDENDELRRKEEILRSIPDLVVVFDSAGKLWFVSHSVSRFLEFTPSELEGTSFWDRLCGESVRLLKAAFMDALAARTPVSRTTPLGSGCWELRLVDRDGSQKVVTMNGVVHFTKDAPECVCSIRPRDEIKATGTRKTDKKAWSSSAPDIRNVSVNSSSNGSSGSSSYATSSSGAQVVRPGSSAKPQSENYIKPHQSVMVSASSDSSSSISNRPTSLAKGAAQQKRHAPAHQFNDDVDGCVISSESGGDE